MISDKPVESDKPSEVDAVAAIGQLDMAKIVTAAKNRLLQQAKKYLTFACRVCGCNYYHPIGPQTNLLYTCDECGVVFTDPRKFTSRDIKEPGEQAA